MLPVVSFWVSVNSSDNYFLTVLTMAKRVSSEVLVSLMNLVSDDKVCLCSLPNSSLTWFSRSSTKSFMIVSFLILRSSS